MLISNWKTVSQVSAFNTTLRDEYSALQRYWVLVGVLFTVFLWLATKISEKELVHTPGTPAFGAAMERAHLLIGVKKKEGTRIGVK